MSSISIIYWDSVRCLGSQLKWLYVVLPLENTALNPAELRTINFTESNSVMPSIANCLVTLALKLQIYAKSLINI